MNKFLSIPVSFFVASLALAIILPVVAIAKEGDKKLDTATIMPAENEKSILLPNLTVNFRLNSVLGEKETAYYAQIVEKMLSNLPKKVTLTGEESNLLSGSNKYDKLKIVAYFPASGEEISDNPLNKDTRSFDVEFELPREKKLKRVSENANGATPTVVEPKTSFEDFMAKIAGMKNGGDISKSAMPAHKIIPVKEANKKSAVINKVVDKSPVTNNVTKKLILNYFDDSVKFSSSDDELLKTLVDTLKSSGNKRLKVVTQTAASPFISWTEVKNNRIKYLEKMFKSYGVDFKDISVSFIHLKSEGKQSINLEI